VHENEFTVHKQGVWQVPRGMLSSFLPSRSYVHLHSFMSVGVLDIFPRIYTSPALPSSRTTAVALPSTRVGKPAYMPSQTSALCAPALQRHTTWDARAQGKRAPMHTRSESTYSHACCGVSCAISDATACTLWRFEHGLAATAHQALPRFFYLRVSLSLSLGAHYHVASLFRFLIVAMG
jgi:hypothetical protein